MTIPFSEITLEDSTRYEDRYTKFDNDGNRKDIELIIMNLRDGGQDGLQWKEVSREPLQLCEPKLHFFNFFISILIRHLNNNV